MHDVAKSSNRFLDESLKMKDTNYISDRIYSNIRKTFENNPLPTLYSIRKCAKSFNTLAIYTNQKGVYVSIEEKLKKYITILIIQLKKKRCNLINP